MISSSAPIEVITYHVVSMSRPLRALGIHGNQATSASNSPSRSPANTNRRREDRFASATKGPHGSGYSRQNAFFSRGFPTKKGL